MTRNRRIAVGLTTFTLAVGFGYALRSARAAGIPATKALSYSGALEDSNGPVAGTHNIQVTLYDAATAGNQLCQAPSAPIAIANGRFNVQLPDACTTAAGANQNIWIDVFVDGADTGRTPIGAVPYAVEANHAVNATTAQAAGGALAQQIVPSGAVMAFNLAACPSGWSAFAAAGGRTIIGVNGPGGNGLSQRNLGATLGEEAHTQTVSEMPSHNHDLYIDQAAPSCGGGYWGYSWPVTETCASTEPNLGGGLQNFMTVQAAGGSTPFNQMQPSLALLYCQKN